MTVRQLLANTDSRELSEWMAYFQVENEDRMTGKDKPGSIETKIKGAFTQLGAGVK